MDKTSSTLKKYKKILVPVAFGEDAEYIVKIAASFASIYKAHIILLHVIEESFVFPAYEFVTPHLSGFDTTKLIKEREIFIDQLAKDSGLKKYEKLVCSGFPQAEILEAVKKLQADLIILGGHRRDALDFLLGSVSNKVLQKTDRDVYVVKTTKKIFTPKKILVCTDLTNETGPIIQRSAELAFGYSAQLHIIHVLQKFPTYDASINAFEQEIVDQAKQKIEQIIKTNLLDNVISGLVIGVPKYEIINYTQRQDIDLIVIGSHGRSGISSMLGSVANSVLNRASCDIFTIRVGK